MMDQWSPLAPSAPVDGEPAREDRGKVISLSEYRQRHFGPSDDPPRPTPHAGSVGGSRRSEACQAVSHLSAAIDARKLASKGACF